MAWFVFPPITPTEDIATLLAPFLFLHHALEPLVFLPLLVRLYILVLWQILVCNISILIYKDTLLFRIEFSKLLGSTAKLIEVPRIEVCSIQHSVTSGSSEATFKGISLRIVLIGWFGVEVLRQLSVLL